MFVHVSELLTDGSSCFDEGLTFSFYLGLGLVWGQAAISRVGFELELTLQLRVPAKVRSDAAEISRVGRPGTDTRTQSNTATQTNNVCMHMHVCM